MPTIEEESFPRGGTVSVGNKRKHKNQEQELFRSNQDDEGSKPKKKKDRHVTLEKRVAVKKRKDKEVDKIIKKNLAAITPLTIATCPVNMLVLGCVKEVHDYHLDVSLPNGLTGRVPITAVSDGYTDLLQKLAKGDFSVAKDIKSLTELFRPGMVVRCKVTEVPKKESKKQKLGLSLNPRDLNNSLASAGLRNGMVLCGCISSIEEHGYVADLGVTGIVAFLKKKEAKDYIEDYNDGKPLHIGSYVHCMVNAEDKVEVIMGESRTVQVTINPRQTFRAEVKTAMGIKMNTLIPGMRVTAKIQKVFDKGVKVHFLAYSGTIHRSHLTQHSMKLEHDQELTAAVLYVHPVTKVVSLTCQTHLVCPDLAPKRLFGDFQYGQIVEEAKVLKVDAKSGVYLKLDDRVVGFARSGNLSDGEIKDVSRQFPKNSTVRCRVMNFDYCDNVVLVTLKKSILSRQFLRYEDIKIAEDIEVEVKEVTKGGVSVTISNHIKGFIPNTHLADVPLKHPERRFTPGTKVSARVLTVNTETKKIILTTKKTILSSTYHKLTEYDQARSGMVLEGVVTKVVEKGLRVLFYNGVKGFVPQGLLSTEFVGDLSKVFYIGQVVKVQVVKSVPDEEKLILSLQIKNKSAKKKSKIQIPSDIEGKICDVVVRGKVEKGLFVDLVDSEVQAFLPKEHLSDHLLNCELLHAIYTTGDQIEDCAVFSTDKRIVVTKKQCFVSAARNETLIENFEDVKLGLEMPGSIRNRMDYGLFVDLPASLIGLAPVKFLLDEHVPDPTSLYQLGQSVVAKVTEVNEEKKRLLVSLRLKDCYHGDIEEGISLLDNYLSESARIVELYRERGEKQTLASHAIGELVKVTVTKVTNQGVLCSLPDGTKALATDDHVREVKCDVGKQLEAVVLYVDLKANCLEVSLNTRLVEQVKHYADTKFTKARRGQSIKSEVLLIKDDFVLVALKGHTQGLLAYLPAKTHLNDVLEKRQYQITQQNAVVIKQTGDNVLACLQMHDKGDKSQKGETAKEKVASHHFLPGVITKAKIKQVLDFQLNIVMGGMFGRVHISEVADKVKVGTNPLKKFQQGQEVRVKVIGYRQLKTSKHLPVNHSQIWKALPECSMQASKLKTQGLLKSEDVHESSFGRGTRVTVYVQNFSKNCLWVHVSPKFRGRIRRHNISEEEEVQKNPFSQYTVGMAYKATVLGPGKANVLELSLIGILEEINEGEDVEGTITEVGERGIYVKLEHNYTGRVGLTDIADRYEDRPWTGYKVGQTVTAHVLKVNKDEHKCVLSLRQSRVSEDAEDVQDPELSVEDVKEGEMLHGYVSNNSNRKKVFVTLSHDIGAKIDAEKLTETKLKRPASVFFVGKVVHGKITGFKSGDSGSKRVAEMSLLEADTGLPSIPTDAKDEKVEKASKRKATKEDEPKSLKQKKVKKEATKPKVKDATEEEEDDGDSDSGVEEDIRLLSPKAMLKTDTPRLSLSAGFTWDNTFSLPPPEVSKEDSDSDSEEEEGTDKKKKTRRTRQERLAAQREEERRLLETERRLVGSDQQPTSAEDFDRLVLQSPDSSLIWLGYMAHHLETTEIEKARTVAERALKTISFREEQEKMNVWVAFLNLENLYGTADTLKAVFERAVQHNEPLKVYTQLVGIYDKSDKTEAAEQLYTTMIRRFSSVKDVWINFGLFLFKHNKADEARKLMQRSLKSLDQKHHVEVISKFAQMEFKTGEAERGKTMFENVLSSYPRRTDLWSVYIDMVIKLGQHQQVRNIFERVIALNLAAKKMKFFFKKQLDFEQKHGNDETVAAVKQKALDYVEARAALT